LAFSRAAAEPAVCLRRARLPSTPPATEKRTHADDVNTAPWAVGHTRHAHVTRWCAVGVRVEIGAQHLPDSLLYLPARVRCGEHRKPGNVGAHPENKASCDNAAMAGDVLSTLSRLFEESAPSGLTSAYCFGSQVTGRAHRDSDVDVAVLLDWAAYPDRKGRFDAQLRLAGDVAHALGRNDIDLVVLNDAPPHLARAIACNGRRVYCRDREADHAFIRDVQLRAADLEPFLRRTRRVKLDAILR
jgi:predicted nucleotidyltransferase